MRPEFDALAAGYDTALDDPWRARFADNAEFFVDQKCRAMIREIERRNGHGASPARTLDVGCGRGPAVAFMRERWPTFGSDVSMAMLREAPSALPLVAQEPHRLPFADNVFDVVFAICVYHHLERHEFAAHMREMVRVAKPGGLVFVFEHNPYNPVTQVVFRRAPIDQGHVMLRPRELRAVFRAGGLTALATRYVLFFPQSIARRAAGLDDVFRMVPLGGQYFVSGRKPHVTLRGPAA
jgi:SAM-dependent methyltransferase